MRPSFLTLANVVVLAGILGLSGGLSGCASATDEGAGPAAGSLVPLTALDGQLVDLTAGREDQRVLLVFWEPW